jgi:hypothetical protein
MKKLVMLCAIFFVALPLALGSCKGGPVTTPVPTAYLFVDLVTVADKAPDSIVWTPDDGPSYIANTSSANNTENWPPIEMAQAIMQSGDLKVNITYRKLIETRAGETRNNIIYSFIAGHTINSFSLYAVDVPRGITLTDGMEWVGPFSRSAVLVIDVSVKISARKYTFEIGLNINNIDSGTIPCTINVIK